MSDVNANIGIHFDTSDALAQLRRLQAGLSKFNQALTEGNLAASNAQKGLNAQLVQSINATGKFVASQKNIASSTAAFTDALEKNKLSMGQYFRYTAAAATQNSKVFSNAFKQEKDILNRAMKDRVKSLQTQYVQLTNANGDLVKVLQVVPKHLRMVNGQYADYTTRTQMAAQRQQMLNQLIKQGSTQLLNFGKNTQWAGRQLMVGLTIPLTMLGSAASKVFREMEMATLKFTRVYGDMTTAMSDTDAAVASIQSLAKEFTKYGIAATKTMEMAADAAAMGLTGSALESQVVSATKLAVLGQVEQQQALETTISLQNAFGVSSEQLAQKIDFLNAVENQTVLSIEDLTIAIPKAGPVVKQLGGNVEDLAFFMTAMKEGGINASEGANALKSGLASMINPAKKTSEFLASLGINIKGIVNANAGDIKGTVIGLANALDTLAPLDRARAIEQLFGKFQFSRLSTLFQNVTKDSSQAARALGLAGASVEELAILSERELGKVEDAVGVKFQKQLENLKLELVPLGKAFLEAVTPVVEFAGKILAKFNSLSDGTKKFVVGFVALVGGIAPVLLMTVGLVANGVANLIKFFGLLRGGMAKLNGQNNVLGGSFDYLTQAEIDNLAQSQALHTSHKELINTFNVEKTSVDLLAASYQNAASQARALASGSPGLFNAAPGAKGAVSGLPKFADGKVPGNESEGDSVLALVAPGETIVPTALSKKYGPILKAIMGDKLPGFKTGKYSSLATQADKTYSASVAGGSTPVETEIQNELGRIRNLTKNQLIDYAKRTGQDVSDTSEAALEAIRETIVGEFKGIIEDVKKEFGTVTVGGIEKVGKAYDKDKGSSRMGAYAPAFDQLERRESAHVGQTERLEASKLELIDAAQAQIDGIKDWYEANQKPMPDLKVADAHLFGLKGRLNNAMSTPEKSQAYEKENGKGSLGRDFVEDFADRGAEKWREMTVLTGDNFDQLKGQAEVYDNALQQRLKSWYADQEKKIASGIEPDMMTDDVFAELEYEVRQGIKDQIPEWNAVIEKAKQSITEIRIAVGEDFDELNAYLQAQGLGSLGTSASNPKILNNAARMDPETGKLKKKILGTQPMHEQGAKLGDAVIDGVRSSDGTAAGSPSKKGIDAGKEVGDGLVIGLEQSEAKVKSQSAQLGSSAIPPIDKTNKDFYDDINTPEMRDQRQILKSQDRQRRKRASRAKPRRIVITPSAAAMPGSVQRISDATSIAESSEEESKIRTRMVSILKATAKAAARTRNSSRRSAQVSTDVLESEESIRSSADTRESSSRTIADDTVTTAQLTEAAAKSAKSSADSAKKSEKYDDEIEANKKIIAEQGRKEVAARAAAGQIPMGSQTVNGIVNPATAMGYADAYDLSGEFTRDKNGSVLLDPETGDPTTMSKKQITKKRRGMRREKVSKFSGKVSGGLGTAAMVAGMAGAPPQVTAALGTAATVAQFAPMLAATGPIGLAVAGIAALGGGIYLLNKHLSDAAFAAAKFVRSTAATTDKMVAIGKITGKVGSSELMSRRGTGSLFQDYNEVSRKSTTFGNTFLKGKEGKEIQKAVSENMTKNGNEAAAKDLARQLSYYVSDGIMTGEQANSIAQQIGVNLKNQEFGFDVKAKIVSLIGADGNNLYEDPVEARINLIADNRAKVDAVETEAYGGESFKTTANAVNVSRTEAAELQALDANALQLAQSQADAIQRIYLDKKRSLDVELAGTTNAQRRAQIEGELATLNAQNVKDSERMNEQVGLSLALAEERFKNTIYQEGFKIKGREGAAFDASRQTITDMYDGTGQEEAAKTFLDKSKRFDDAGSGFTDDKSGQTFQYKMEMMVGNKMMTPEQANAMLDTFAGSLPELDAALNLGIKQFGSRETMKVLNMFSGFTDKAVAKTLIANIIRKDKKEFEATAKTIASLQALAGEEINLEVTLTTLGAEGLDLMTDRLQEIENLKDSEVTVTMLTTLAEKNNINSPELQAMMKQPWFLKMKPGEQKEVLQKYTQLHMANAIRTPAAILADAEAQAKLDLYKKYGTIDTDGVHKMEFAELTTKYVKTLEDTDKTTATQVEAFYKTNSLPDPKVPGDGGIQDGAKERDTTYDNLLTRLRNVRLASINAAGGFAELKKALANTGIKAINDQFRGLEQQLIKTGKAGQFVEFLAGLDQEELNKFGKAATKKGIDPNTGKKNKKVKVGDFVLNDKGKTMEKGFNKAIIGDFNKAQLQSVTLAKQEIAARGKLLALGFDERDIKTMLADENYKTLIATGKVTKAELETNAALTKQQRIRNQINGAVAGLKDKIQVSEDQKRIPEVIKMMQDAGMNAQAIREAISDPDMLSTLINGMDNFSTLAKDAQDEFNHLLSQIDGIPERKMIEIIYTQTDEDKKINAANAAAEMFDAFKMIDENTVKNAEGNTFAGLQTKMEDLNNQAKIAQNAINLTQSKIDDMQKEVDKDQRDIETNFTRPIDAKQRAIEKLTRSADLNFSRPIQALQDRSNVLSHDLEVMNRAADEINKKYDKQQEALQEVAKVNQQIIQQQQQQLGLADALSKGDISAAAKAVQDMRAANASNYAQNSQDALQKARENEIGKLRGGVSGKSQEDIEKEQWEISQLVYDLELKKAAVDKQILVIQDEIYALEEKRTIALDAVQVKTDAIAKIVNGTLLDQQTALKKITDQNLEYQSQSDLLAAVIDKNDKIRVISGQNRAEWELTKKAAEAQKKLLEGDLALALAAASTVSGDIKGKWDDIKKAYDGIKSKSVTITEYINRVYGPMPQDQQVDDKQETTEDPVDTAAALRKLQSGQALTDAERKALGMSPNTSTSGNNGAGGSVPSNYGAGAGGATVGGSSAQSNGGSGSSSTQKGAGSVATSTPVVYTSADAAKTAADKKSAGPTKSPEAAKLAAEKAVADRAAAKVAAAKQAASDKLAADRKAAQAAKSLFSMPAGIGKGYSKGGLIPQYLASGGFAIGTDTVPAMLTPGEFVMSRYAVNTHGVDTMKALNEGASIGDSVYNYNLSVNVKSDANPNDIARTVIAQIKQIDSQRIGGNRF